MGTGINRQNALHLLQACQTTHCFIQRGIMAGPWCGLHGPMRQCCLQCCPCIRISVPNTAAVHAWSDVMSRTHYELPESGAFKGAAAAAAAVYLSSWCLPEHRCRCLSMRACPCSGFHTSIESSDRPCLLVCWPNSMRTQDQMVVLIVVWQRDTVMSAVILPAM